MSKKIKHVVIYEIKNIDKIFIEKRKVFNDVASACSFFNEIKSISSTIPVIETIEI